MADPIIRWAGSKKKIVKHLAERAPNDYNKYVELFAGSACLFFYLQPEQSILNDINKDLINAYTQAKRFPKKIAECLNKLEKNTSTYYKVRSLFNSATNNFDKAVYFFYLNRFCFNAVYRTNNKGEFNVPIGTRTGGHLQYTDFKEAKKAFKNTSFYSNDFESILSIINKNDFVYLDPPYYESKRQDLYGLNSLKNYDLERFLLFTIELNKKGAKLMISYKMSENFKNFYKDWNIAYLDNNRFVSGFSKGRAKVKELLITNY